MNRREFAARLGLAGAATSLLPTLVQAQGTPAEGRDYVRLQTPAPTSASGKVEVVEFFGYWCPHCNAFEPSLDAWVRKLPAHVSFKRIPVAFQAAQEIHQRLYFTLEAMGQVDAMHRKVFGAMHVQKMRLDKEADILALVTANGVDGAKFADTFKSFTVQTKVRQARQLAEAYKIDGVPTIGIQGRFFTSPSLTGGAERALAVADFLIERSRGG
jgi:protein dithiol oxidoreductase (disulfide-forming)